MGHGGHQPAIIVAEAISMTTQAYCQLPAEVATTDDSAPQPSNGGLVALSFSGNGRYIASSMMLGPSSSGNCLVSVFNWRLQQLIFSRSYAEGVRCLAWKPGEAGFLGGGSHAVWFWARQHGIGDSFVRRNQELPSVPQGVQSLEICADGAAIVLGGGGTCWCLSPEGVCLKEQRLHDGRVSASTLLEPQTLEGPVKQLLIGCQDGTLKVWQVTTMGEALQLMKTVNLSVPIVSVCAALGRPYLIGAGTGEILMVEEGSPSGLSARQPLFSGLVPNRSNERGKALCLAWLSASNALAIASNTGALTLWDIHSHSITASTNFPGLIHAMAAAPTGRTLAVSVELQPQQSEGTEESAATEGTTKERKRQGARSAIGSHRSTAGAVPSSGRPAAARTEAKEEEAAVGPAVMLLEGATLKQLQRLPLTSGHATALAWNSDGSSLAVGSNDGGITIWRRSDSGGNGTGNGGSAAFVPVLESVKGEGKGVAHLAWSVDGKLLCSGDAHGEVRYWRVELGKLLPKRPKVLPLMCRNLVRVEDGEDLQLGTGVWSGQEEHISAVQGISWSRGSTVLGRTLRLLWYGNADSALQRPTAFDISPTGIVVVATNSGQVSSAFMQLLCLHCFA